MRGFNAYLKRRQERRKELSSVLRAIGDNQSILGETNTNTLRKIAFSRHITEGMSDMVNRHLGSEAISHSLGPRSRR